MTQRVHAAAHDRTVHREIARAAMLGALRVGESPATKTVRDLLRAGAPVPERLHNSLLGALGAGGWDGFRHAAGHLLDRPRSSEIEQLVRSRSIDELLHHAGAAQLRYYSGHSAEFGIEAHGLTVEHRPLLGEAPTLAESLFLAACHLAVVRAWLGAPCRIGFLLDGIELELEEAARLSTVAADHGATSWTVDFDLPDRELRDSERTWLARLVRSDPARLWQIADVARQRGVSVRSLQRALQKTDATFGQVVIHTRLDLAVAIIERTSLRLADVAAATGFADHAHLSRCFRSRFGVAPSAWRTSEATRRPVTTAG